MAKQSVSARKLSASEAKRRALLGADWFVNTQVVHHQPALSGEHGRVYYNYHMPSGFGCRGLSWSHGRAIMCLLAAWRATRRQKYLDAAVRCGLYLRYSLQVMDPRDKRIFGAFREEVPVSRFCYPRDAIEAAFGLLMLYGATGEPDYLERCEIFADWYLTHVVDKETNWPRGAIYFDEPQRRAHDLKFFQAGGAPFFWHLYQVTKVRRYLIDGLKMLADGLLERFFDAETGAILSPVADRHHASMQGGKAVALNDDGAAIALTCAHAAFGKNARAEGPRLNGTSKYLDAAMRYGDWLIGRCPRPIPLWAAPGMHAINLTELAAVTGQKRYADFAARLMAGHAANQVVSPARLDRHGAFRGEDEPANSYVPGSRQRDFITTRSTAYAVLAMFRLSGLIGPSYSALGLVKD